MDKETQTSSILPGEFIGDNFVVYDNTNNTENKDVLGFIAISGVIETTKKKYGISDETALFLISLVRDIIENCNNGSLYEYSQDLLKRENIQMKKK